MGRTDGLTTRHKRRGTSKGADRADAAQETGDWAREPPVATQKYRVRKRKLRRTTKKPGTSKIPVKRSGEEAYCARPHHARKKNLDENQKQDVRTLYVLWCAAILQTCMWRSVLSICVDTDRYSKVLYMPYVERRTPYISYYLTVDMRSFCPPQ
jgi:hypothetical protein